MDSEDTRDSVKAAREFSLNGGLSSGERKNLQLEREQDYKESDAVKSELRHSRPQLSSVKPPS
jgi:hypothetical protein